MCVLLQGFERSCACVLLLRGRAFLCPRVYFSSASLQLDFFSLFFFDGKGNRCCMHNVALLKKKKQLHLKETLMAAVFCSSTPVKLTV